MVKNKAEIDVLFRDGLRDMEVLPPADVWDNISSSIGRRNMFSAALRVAAGIAALTILGTAAYFAGSRSLDNISPDLTAAAGIDNPVEEVTIDPAGELAAVSPVAVVNRNEGISDMSAENEVDYSQQQSLQTEADETKQDNILLSFNQLNNNINPEGSISSEVETLKPAMNIFVPDISDDPIIEKETDMQGRWKVGARVSPTYLSSNLLSSSEQISTLQDNESVVMSYTGGISVSYRMAGRLSLQTGVYYSSLGREINGISSYSGFLPYSGSKSGTIFDVTTSSGQISSTNGNIFLTDNSGQRISGIYNSGNFDPEKANLSQFGNSLRQNFEYIEIPFMLSYKIIDRRIDFNLLGGLSYNVLVNNRAWAVNGNEMIPIGSTSGMSDIILSSAFGMSMEYNLSGRLSLNLEPSFRYYLNPGTLFTPGNPYTIGLFSGFTYKF